MKVILVNGSGHEYGTTRAALDIVAERLNEHEINTEIFWVGNKPIMGCEGCGRCSKDGRCWYNEDTVNEFVERAEQADGFIFGTSIHFAGTTGFIKPFMDRAFCGKSKPYIHKPAAAVIAGRRAGSTSAFDDMNKYFAINCMPIVTSNYWNEVHGSKAEDVAKDEEGCQTMRILADNMAWMLRCIEAGKEQGIEAPAPEKKIRTNFIR